MEGSDYKTAYEVLKRAQEAVGIPMREIDMTGRIETGKGAIGTVIEESWFGYKPNSESEPDFSEAKIELKATPYVRNRNGISAKERLVCNLINYMTEYRKTFYTSDFWHKCEHILIMSYEHRKDVPKADFVIDKAVLFSFPDEDKQIIQQDWEKIMSKVRAGEAHLLTEGDTLYLAACTKGKDASSVRPQPFSDIPAKQRAYSLKTSYMTKILKSYIFGEEKDEHIITDWHVLIDKPFESVVEEKLRPYYGKSVRDLVIQFDLFPNAKNLNEVLLSKMLELKGRVSQTAEFQNANIIPKTIRIQKNGTIKESMSFPTFKFTEIINEDWETSDLRQYLEPAKFMFVIFHETEMDDYEFGRIMFWNIPSKDLEEVKRVWERTVEIIRAGVQLIDDGNCVRNNLPKATESPIAHVRPHARNASDTYPLPDGREMTKQCFWFNSSYVKRIISGDNHETSEDL